jgi:alpha/beta superfamily hydrolase
MQNLPRITAQWILVQGGRDDVVSPEAVLAWAESRDPRPIVIRFPQAGHFFHGQLSELSLQITDALRMK